MAKVNRTRTVEVTLGVRVFLWIVLAMGVVVVALHIGNTRSTARRDVPANPFAALEKLVRGELPWPPGATMTVIIEIAIIAAACIAWIAIHRLAARTGQTVDEKARFMGTGDVLASLTAAGARKKADTLGMRLGDDDAPGVFLGTSVTGDERLYGSYDALYLDIWGPRQGKSACRAIPAVVDAIGPVIVTSNKRDIVDATRGIRATKGGSIWVFDPDGVAGEAPDWFWDPIAWVGGDDLRAAHLARHFAAADRRTDAHDYFEIEGEELLAALFLAASVDHRSITQVWEWVTYPRDTEPLELLRRDGRSFVAAGLAAVYNMDIRQQTGIFGTAKKMARCLRFTRIHPWITPDSERQAFDEVEFIDTHATLYALSVEGRGAAVPLVSAFIEAVLDRAATLRRTDTPLLAVMDDAANVVRWRDFPQRSSYYASRGVIVMTMLQSWAQGVRCWGHDGMNELWSAATIKSVGGGVDDVPFLRNRVDGIGNHDVESRSVTVSTRGIGYSSSITTTSTLGVPELRSLPRGRAVLFAPGTTPVLIKTEPWWEGPHADEVRASIGRYGIPSNIRDLIERADEFPAVIRLDAPDSDPGKTPGVTPL
ncbi:type IV secretory system conjugative DNA transfer family protein [Nocardia exalbida]|uniref:type IV secretory system conjugative DNA transfer family protein n=1 Tax=Nocardia exalbida TaxID=290231 RepID=UPI0006876F1B|nr:type IV secretory system conjugative DNA transfer family protein [Nocardia exalbida]